ncbi:MAG: glycosyltransferase [Limimaricola sp.]|uniref:glycosyltransferase family 2 protein n=1 Tax=Limimaricola sp. TaxID=2211665 RepID=UPI001DF55766|nr:glycosyltransferase family 2 protein [Limimaricola sp.]MBI1416186.1 glycosyltransferase [Limimaricola sp.]
MRHEGRLADILRYDLALPARQIAEIEASILGTGVIDPLAEPADPRLLARIGAAACLRRGLLPWRRTGGETVVLSARPEQFARHRAALTRQLGPVRLAVTTETALQAAIHTAAGAGLASAAEAQLPERLSCRDWATGPGRVLALALAGLAMAALMAPRAVLAGLLSWTVLTLVAGTGLKLAALLASLRPAPEPACRPRPARLPIVTLLVPLFEERAIASHLIARLSQTDYPHALLDVILILEASDATTAQTLREINLPRWMRAIRVPPGRVQTKPRALNYALRFARGSIVGVYDAEDAPARGQVAHAVETFAARGPEVVCLQGRLDFYNDATNWIARCFTLEYAVWFRVILPGLARLGLVVPLGGTTLFFRRQVLERLGGWDAHNVTEDADLGVRLARAGYVTEVIDTVTTEEANCRAWPWVRQRSRWLKGYAMTWAVHLRAPRRLWHELGPRRFLGVQVLLAGTLTQFALAPLLWAFWLVPMGLGGPLASAVPAQLHMAVGGLFAASALVDLAAAGLGAWRADKARLIPWALTLPFYFPLATLAVYKALWELLRRPFYWDKTAHGLHGVPALVHTAPAAPLRPAVQPPARPASAG